MKTTTLLLILLFSLPAFWACDDDELKGRSDFLIVSETPEQEASDGVYCPITGGLDTLYVFANVGYEMFFQTAEDEDWVREIQSDYLTDLGATRLILEISPMQAPHYKRRTSTLSFSAKDNLLGQFLLFSQGFNVRLSESFDWLTYGSANPLDASRETSIDNWTQEQTTYGWGYSLIEGHDSPYSYGKYGYVKLGNESYGGDIMTPFVSGILSDKVLILTFDAVAYVNESGEKDANKLLLEVLGGGEFAQGGKETTVTTGYYDPGDPRLSKSMWNDAYHVFYIIDTQDNPITGATKVRFSTLSKDATTAPNRVFVDNINLYTVDKNSYYLAENN